MSVFTLLYLKSDRQMKLLDTISSLEQKLSCISKEMSKNFENSELNERLRLLLREAEDIVSFAIKGELKIL